MSRFDAGYLCKTSGRSGFLLVFYTNYRPKSQSAFVRTNDQPTTDVTPRPMSHSLPMYWLRWHYHVEDIAGAPYKIKRKSKQKQQNCRQSVVAGRQQLYCAVQSNHDRLVIVKRRPEKYSLQLATERCQRQCIPDMPSVYRPLLHKPHFRCSSTVRSSCVVSCLCC